MVTGGAALFLAACSPFGDAGPAATHGGAAASAAPATAAPAATPVVVFHPPPIANPDLVAIGAYRAAAKSASLRTRIGQMLLVGFSGRTVNANSEVIRDIHNHALGAVLLYDFANSAGNISAKSTLRKMIAALKAASPLPLLVATDQEGGSVARLGPDHGYPATVSAEVLGTRNDLAYTHAKARAMATTLRGVGINFNLAPVVDLDRNPDNPIIGRLHRSFSADPAIVVANATEFIAAHHELAVHTTLKHFPGHGSSTANSHLGVVDVSDTWDPIELEPFRQIVAAGHADAVMTAHIFNSHLDAQHPATLSKPTITGILRDQLGFDGVVVSDDMQMGAIRKTYGYNTAVLLAIRAGVDLLTISNHTPHSPGIVGRTIDLIEGFVKDGKLTEARIDESWVRIQRLKGL